MDNTESMIVSLIQDEITHHGIVGMKWGVRRFQNKDGSLTAAGKKRVGQKSGSITSAIKKRIGKKEDPDTPAKPKPKSVNEMTDEELAQKIRRLQLEKQYRDLQPQKVSKGKEIANKFLDQAIVPAATNMGKQFLEKQLKKALGLNEKNDNSLDAMKKKLDELRTTNQLYNQKKTYEKNKAEMEAERKAKEDAEKAEREAKKAEKAAKKEAKKQKVVVEPLGTDYKKEDKSSSDYKTVWEYDYVPNSAKDTPYYSRETQELIVGGRQYITALLEEPK